MRSGRLGNADRPDGIPAAGDKHLADDERADTCLRDRARIRR